MDAQTNTVEAMNEQASMAEVMRTYAGAPTALEKLTLSALGLAGESGEVADTIKKIRDLRHPLSASTTVHLVEELGDVLWYLMLACNALECTLEDVMTLNVMKLRSRYPNGFEAARSINRAQAVSQNETPLKEAATSEEHPL